jgi:MoaA/NifB/PqqE/SkfB family radical SAM enzyme
MTTLSIETTTRCTLKCPACSRTEFSKQFNRQYPHYDIDTDSLYNFLDCKKGREISQLKLEGDHGDVIYYPKLFYFLEKFRSSKKFMIVTNGAYRDEKFWIELCARLDQRDTIVFSIDGLEDTNHLYRINSDWKSTMLGVDIVGKTNINLHWQTNIFNFNHDKIDKIKEFAESKNAKFFVYKTARFGDDNLRPPEQYIDVDALYDKKYSQNNIELNIDPKCTSQEVHSVTAQNYYVPCGWISSPFTYYKSDVWKHRKKWTIKNQTLDDIYEITLPQWIEQIKNDPIHCDTICKMKCKSDQQRRIQINV